MSSHHGVLLVALAGLVSLGACTSVETLNGVRAKGGNSNAECAELPNLNEPGGPNPKCVVLECDQAGNCSCPLALPDGRKQPLDEERCQQAVAAAEMDVAAEDIRDDEVCRPKSSGEGEPERAPQRAGTFVFDTRSASGWIRLPRCALETMAPCLR